MSSVDRVNILLVDDEPKNLVALEAILEPLGERLVRANSGEEALKRVLNTDFAVILLDVRMPTLSGFDTARIIRSRQRSSSVPIIFLTAADRSDFSEEAAYALGAVDYLAKPLSPTVLRAKVGFFAEMYRLRSSERERHFKDIAAERERLADLFQFAPSLMCVLAGPEHVFERANDRYLELIGRRDIIGKPMHVAVPELVGQGYIELLDSVYWSGKPYIGSRIPTRLQREVGQPLEERFFDFAYQPLRNATGSVTGIFAQGIDVTDRVRAEETLRRTDERLNLLVSNVTDYAVIISDPNGIITEWQGGAEAITGYCASEAIGEQACIIFTPEDRAAEMPKLEMAEAARNGRAEDMRWHIRKDGSRFYANGTMTALWDEAGNLRGFGKVFRDETNRVLAEARQQFLAELASATQPLTDPEEVTAVSARLLAEYLRADRCAYAEVEDENVFVVTGDYARQVPSIVGRWPMTAFGDGCVRDMLASEPYVVFDTDTDPRIKPEDLNAYRATTIRSVICIPLHKDGRLTAAMAVHQAVPRRWSAQEVELVQTVVGRCWEALERTRALRRMRQSEEQLRLITDAVPALISYVGPDRRYRLVNKAYEEWFGQPREHLEGKAMWDVLGDAAWKVIEPHIEQALNGSTATFEAKADYKHAGTRWIHARYIPDKDKDGHVYGITILVTDISSRKRSEEELARAAATEKRRSDLLAAVAKTAQLIYSDLSIESIIRTATDEARQLIDAHHAVTSLTVGEDWSQTMSAVSLSSQYAACGSYSGEPYPWGIYAEVCRNNTPVRMTHEQLAQQPACNGFGSNAPATPPPRGCLAVPLVGHGNRNLGLMQLSDKVRGDFTAEDEAVLSQLAAIAAVGIENAKLYQSLREQDRRKDEFLATLAHELRNPLAPLRTGLQVMKLASTDTKAIEPVRSIMERQLWHMVRLIDDLLDVSRISRGMITLQKERINLLDVVKHAVETCAPLIEASNHSLSIEVASDSLFVDGDFARLSQVMSNLLNNAAKYSHSSGQIALRTYREGDSAVISVQDQGVGIPSVMLDQVFEMFTQVGGSLEQSKGGLGIGLALVKNFIEMHSGTVEAISEGLGKGSTFIVRLPLSEFGVSVAGPRIDAKPAEIAKHRLLVIDDNKDAANTLALMLRLRGCEAEVAYDGATGLEVAASFQPELVLCDIGMPGMDGYEVARRMRRLPAAETMTLVALTGWGNEEDRRRSAEAGFDHHIVKPADPADLEALLASLHSQNPRNN